jgi:hypothetical protein
MVKASSKFSGPQYALNFIPLQEARNQLFGVLSVSIATKTFGAAVAKI